MSNELLLILSLAGIFALVLGWFYFFGKTGLIAFTVFATITANIEVLICIEAFGMEQTLGNILFAASFLITDILSELYGKKEAQKAVNIGIATSLSFIVISQTWLLYTPSGDTTIFEAVQLLFTPMMQVMFASFLVYVISQKFDVWVYHKVWAYTTKLTGDKRRYLFIRNNASTLISQLINTVLFTGLAFWGMYDTQTMISIGITSYIIFVITSIADTPAVYIARKIHEKKYQQA